MMKSSTCVNQDIVFHYKGTAVLLSYTLDLHIHIARGGATTTEGYDDARGMKDLRLRTSLILI